MENIQPQISLLSERREGKGRDPSSVTKAKRARYHTQFGLIFVAFLGVFIGHNTVSNLFSAVGGKGEGDGEKKRKV